MSALVKGSLSQIARRDNVSLAETFLDVEMLVLVDTSGSMEMTDAPGMVSRYQAACNELAAIQGKFPGKIAVISFSSYPIFCPSGVPDFLRGGTDMVAALQMARPLDGTDAKIVLISDGEPGDEQGTLETARTFKTRIDTVYVGPEFGGHGREFLIKLSQLTGGKHFKSKAPGLLAESVEQLLLTG